MSFREWFEDADMPMRRDDGTWYDAETGISFSASSEAAPYRIQYNPSADVQGYRDYAKQFGGKALTGSPKQKDWAEKIRAEKLAEAKDHAGVDVLARSKLFSSAKFWIENRTEKGSVLAEYATNYLAVMRMMQKLADTAVAIQRKEKTNIITTAKPVYALHEKYMRELGKSESNIKLLTEQIVSAALNESSVLITQFADIVKAMNQPQAKPQPYSVQDAIEETIKALLLKLEESDDPIAQLGTSIQLMDAIQQRDIHQQHDARVARFIVKLVQERIPEIKTKAGDGDLLDSAQALLADMKAVTKSDNTARIQDLDRNYSLLINRINAIKTGYDSIAGELEGVTDQDIDSDPLAVLDLCVGVLEESTDAITPTGRTNPVKTAKGTKIGTQFAVVEVEKLITSHDSAGNENPAFPQELQPRDRGRDASRAWVAKTANSLDNDSLGRTSRADSGAPIVGRDGIVESGNGRTMAIRMAYDQGTADEYRQFLIDDADYFGIDPDQVERMKRPVLVRVRTTETDRRVFTVEANQDDKLALSATERARSDAKRLDKNMLALFKPDENGSLLTASNHKFIQAFLASLGDAEAAQYVTSGGKPTRALVDRIRAAVFSKAYNDDRLLEMMADDANPDLQNVLNALGAASSKFIEAQAFGRTAVEDTATSMIDGIEQSLDERVTNAVIEATNTLLSARANNQDVAEYVRQQGLFEDIDDGVAALAVFLAQNSRSAKRMAIAFKAMAEYVKDDAISQANNGLFGEPVPPSLIDVVAAANIQLEQQYGSDARGIGLFDSVNPDIKYITDADTQNDPLSVLDACIDFIANVAKGKKNAAKAIEEDDLSFETVADAMLWVELEAKKQGISVSRFTSTPAYHAIYPKIAALQKKEKEARNANLMARFNDSGLKSGDRVQTTVVGLGGAVADVYTGIVKIVSGKPTVYLNQMMTVSRNGRLHDTKKLTWSNQWQKASDSHGFDSFLADGRYDHIHLDDLQMHPYANAAKERQPTAKTPLLVQKNRRGDLYLIAGVKRYEMALDDDVEYLPAVILPVIEGYGDPVIKRVLNAYTGSIDPLALMAAIEDAVIERAGKSLIS